MRSLSSPFSLDVPFPRAVGTGWHQPPFPGCEVKQSIVLLQSFCAFIPAPVPLLVSLLQFSPKLVKFLAPWPCPRGLERQTWSVSQPPLPAAAAWGCWWEQRCRSSAGERHRAARKLLNEQRGWVSSAGRASSWFGNTNTAGEIKCKTFRRL